MQNDKPAVVPPVVPCSETPGPPPPLLSQAGSDPELARLVTLWPHLPSEVRTAIVMLADVSTSPSMKGETSNA